MGWRLDVLLYHCADQAVNVEWMDLGPKLRGGYDHGRSLIVLNTRLTAAQATATLAHECGHQAFGDTCSTPAVERRAWEYGAGLIVSPRQYAAAEQLVGPHPAALALELEVTPRLIEAWRRWYNKRFPIEQRHEGGGIFGWEP